MALAQIGATSVVDSALCLYCENIPESLCAKKTLRYDHQPSFTALKKSASDGCIICQRLIAFSHGTVLKGGESSSDMRVGSPLELRWPSLERVENAVFLVEKSTGNAIVHMELYPVPHEWDEDRVPQTDIEFINGWLETCNGNHVECEAGGRAYLPTRLVDVDPSDGSQNPRIVITAQESTLSGGRARYIALSYCWGKSMPEEVKTKTTNIYLRSEVEGLPLLPRTLSDAVSITRRLGIRYLWIDALCILQDSTDDWMAESGKMGLVYSHAYCTIAAASSSDTAMGFEPMETQLNLRKDKTLLCSETGFKNLQQRYCIGPTPNYWQRLAALPLQRRGWTLQERHLSRRVVYYTDTHVLWQCRCSQSSNDLPWIVMSESQRRDWRLFDKTPVKENLWDEVVEEYSGRSLTYLSDKLPAIAGLASALQSRTRHHYKAGLWQESLPNGLCWRVLEQHFRPTLYRAPTWSWASVEGPISYDSVWLSEFSKPGCMRVLQVDIELASSEEMGSVRNGSLTISGRLRAAYSHKLPVLESESQHHSVEIFDSSSPENCIGTMSLDATTAEDLEPWREIHCLRIAGRGNAPYMSGEMPLGMQNPPQQGLAWPESAWAMLKPTSLALGLVPTGKKKGQYSRVGLIRYMLEEAFEGCQEVVITIV